VYDFLLSVFIQDVCWKLVSLVDKVKRITSLQKAFIKPREPYVILLSRMDVLFWASKSFIAIIKLGRPNIHDITQIVLV